MLEPDLTQKDKDVRTLEQAEALEAHEIEKFCRALAQDLSSCLVEHMAQTPTCYPNDILRLENGHETSVHKTSPTNIGLYLASLVAMRDMEFMTAEQFDESTDTILNSLETAEKHRGLFYNWYSTQTGEAVDAPFISTVDNAWLAVGLTTLRNASPAHVERSDRLLEQMDFATLYDQNQELFYGGYNPENNAPTDWHYGVFYTEARIANYVGGRFGVPSPKYPAINQYLPIDANPTPSTEKCQFPSYGGSMFEALMVTLFKEEPELAENHKLHVEEQIRYGKEHLNGHFGLSSCTTPQEDYREMGISALGVKEGGYEIAADDIDKDVVTPHAVFLSLPIIDERAVKALARLKNEFPGIYQESLGFADSVNVKTGAIAKSRLALDQSMSLLALYNYFTSGGMTRYFSGETTKIQ